LVAVFTAVFVIVVDGDASHTIGGPSVGFLR
jgi:hypothetical protein